MTTHFFSFFVTTLFPLSCPLIAHLALTEWDEFIGIQWKSIYKLIERETSNDLQLTTVINVGEKRSFFHIGFHVIWYVSE